MQVVILVSEDIPAYSEVAKALAKRLGQRGSVRYLSESQVENIKMLSEYKNDEHKQFVSIGLNASAAAKSLTNRQVVFCQVFNYQDYGLLSAKHKGVSMMPSMSKTFSTWRALAPNTTDIGVISGPGFEDMIQTAKATAKSFGIILHHEMVNSDKEFQYAYKQMAGKVQGYWLLPDNRVLSGNILRDVMTFSVHNSKQVAVFSEELLNLGGLFSTISDDQDIAQQVLNRLEQAQNKETIPGPDIVYLDDMNLRINSVMAQRFDLTIPEQYRKYANAP
ncbi:MAG: ABC transporter substrate binding protein [Gallionella sp.]